MFRVFQEEKLITSLMFACLGASILLRVFLGLLYRNMIKETDNMASTENKLLKQCKLKFANCYQLSSGVSNIPVFVDRFLNRMSFGHISFGLIYHLSGQLMLLSVVMAGIGGCRTILAGRTMGDVLPFYIVSFFGLYIYFSVSTVVDVKGKRRALKINLVDYLENHLSPRIDVTRRDVEMLYGDASYGEVPCEGKVRNLGRREKRTVELMPIGGRMAAGGENLTGRENFPGREGLLRRESFPGRQSGPEGEEPSGGQALGREALTEGQGAATALSGREPGESGDSRVSEEELEALLKEFLTL